MRPEHMEQKKVELSGVERTIDERLDDVVAMIQLLEEGKRLFREGNIRAALRTFREAREYAYLLQLEIFAKIADYYTMKIQNIINVLSK
jgi:hypothetical protein